jgi:ATP-dependent helicase/nuclease subunit B
VSVYTIPTGTPFLPTLAELLLARYGATPEELAQVLVILPTQRAVVTLREELLAASQRRGRLALLSPRLMAVTDPDPSGPPVLAELDRRLHLAHLIRQHRGEETLGFSHALALADTLAGLLDELDRHGHTVASLHQLTPDLTSRHWQEMLHLLETVWQKWEQTLTQLGKREAVRAQIDSLNRLAAEWTQQPPQGPVIAAGLIGLFPYLQTFQQKVLHQPQGMVILQGLDHDLPEDLWQTLPADHPQARLQTLLHTLGVARASVQTLGTPPTQARQGLIRQIMLPPAATPAWRRIRPQELQPELAGLSCFTAETAQEEALAVACAVRAVVATPGRTVAVVTASRETAVNIHKHLRRWEILPNDSSGTPLRLTPGGVFLHLVAELAGGRFSPVVLADLLRHPYTRLGRQAERVRACAGAIERLLLRGPRLCHRLEQLPERLRGRLGHPAAARQLAAAGMTEAELLQWLEDIITALTPLSRMLGQRDIQLEQLVKAHIAAAETLAADADGSLLLWKQQDGQELKRLFTNLLAATPLPHVPGSHYPALLRTLLGQASVHMEQPLHARVHVWGPLEAQLHHADTVILADLNDGVFPAQGKHDLWLNRAMKARLGLALTEHKTGLEAHVFCQMLGAETVMLSRARRSGGAPTLPSRWLARLEALLACHDLRLPAPAAAAFAAGLDHPDTRIILPEPRPIPPASARPERLTASDIDLLARNPYGFYAKRILRLAPLDDLDTEPDASTRGTLVHAVLEAFCRAHPQTLPEEAAQRLQDLAEEQFRSFADNPAVQLFWRARFGRIAEWYLEEERSLRPTRQPQALESKGVWTLTIMNRVYTLEARADRIDRTETNAAIVIDYKTGTPPSAGNVVKGQGSGALQLPLTGLILRAGGFGADVANTLAGLEYWHLKGARSMGGQSLPVPNAKTKTTLPDLLVESERFLRALLGAFAEDDQSYLVWPLPWCEGSFDDYAHLARRAEWE